MRFYSIDTLEIGIEFDFNDVTLHRLASLNSSTKLMRSTSTKVYSYIP